MTGEPEWLRLNRAKWDELVGVHLNAPEVYNLDRLRAGTASLGTIASDVLAPTEGLNVLHLQCHFGVDTLTIAQRGATVVGLDFSEPAVVAARRIAVELGLSDRSRFVQANLYDARSALPEPNSFDRVFVSWGALCWLPDIAEWARIVAFFLKPGGWLALAEAHPVAYVFDSSTKNAAGLPGYYVPYFGREPAHEDHKIDYADKSAVLTNTCTMEWLHPLSDTLGGLMAAGLRIESFAEHDSCAWQLFDCLRREGPGRWCWPDRPWLPLSFSLRAVKPA